ncbi:hypothetical protein MAR_024241, partial [Mya arenaria]
MGAICCSEASSSGTNTTKVKQETETGINVDSRYVDASDTIYDYLCAVCERKGKDSKAVAFCKSCTKYYCVPCRDAHDKNHDDHEVYGTDRMGEWKRHRQGNMTYEDFFLEIGKTSINSQVAGRRVTDVAVNVSTEDIFLLNKKQSCVLTLNKEGEKQHDLSDKDLKYPA